MLAIWFRVAAAATSITALQLNAVVVGNRQEPSSTGLDKRPRNTILARLLLGAHVHWSEWLKGIGVHHPSTLVGYRMKGDHR